MRQPTFYMPHGGGPRCFIDGDRGPRAMRAGVARFLREFRGRRFG